VDEDTFYDLNEDEKDDDQFFDAAEDAGEAVKLFLIPWDDFDSNDVTGPSSVLTPMNITMLAKMYCQLEYIVEYFKMLKQQSSIQTSVATISLRSSYHGATRATIHFAGKSKKPRMARYEPD
jgi:hypothetical protein